MKKILLVILASLLLASCVEHDHKVHAQDSTYSFDVVEVDECEYLVGFRHLAHKGDCSNPIHQN